MRVGSNIQCTHLETSQYVCRPTRLRPEGCCMRGMLEISSVVVEVFDMGIVIRRN